MDTATWQIGWVGDRFTGPDGVPRARVWGASSDIAAAHAALDSWAQRVALLDRAPRVRGYTVWWLPRFHLVHTLLTAALPELRALRSVRAEHGVPGEIAIQSPPKAWWPTLVRAVFPESVVRAAPVQESGRIEQAKRVQARMRRATTTARRLKRLQPPRPGQPRVLLVSQSRYWDGARDTELGPVIPALEAKGMEVVVLDQCHGDYVPRMDSWRTRPERHLFGDLLHWRYLTRRARLPRWEGAIGGARLMLESVDLAPLVEGYLREAMDAAVRGLAEYVETVPEFLREIGADAVVTLDENGGEHGIKTGAVIAGVPVIGVQHGCIHADHMNYMYPADAGVDGVPLCDVTCVYGKHERRLLTERSVYGPEHVVVTGRPKDALAAPLQAWGARTPAGALLRKETLPPECDRLLFFTSQDLLHEAVSGPLLDALAAGSARHYLVIRPHPREFDGRHWRERIAARGLRARAQVTTGGTVEEWLDACDVHVSATSTVLSEAVLRGRPNIVIGSRNFGDWLGCVEAGCAVDLADFDGLDAAAGHCLDTGADARAKFEACRAAYIEDHFHSQDGKCAQRIAEVVAGCVSTRAPK